MPIASGAGHWPKEHIVATVVEKVANPSGPSYVQSYMPQYTAPNKIIPNKPAYITQGPPSPPPTSLYPKYPNQPSTPSNGQPYPQYDTPPPRYSSANPRDGGREGPGSPRNGGERQQPWGRNPNQNPQSRPPRSWRATEKYGQGGHHRFGNGGQSTRTEFGHNRYGVRYNSSRQVQFNPKGSRPVGPKGLESYEMYGPRMNMTTGCCGPQMRPLWAMLGGLLALGALGGIIAGIVLGVKANTPVVRNTGYVNPLGSVRYYLQNGAFEPCVDRYATTTKTTPTTPRLTTTLPTTTPKPTPSTTHCIPLTIQTVEAAAPVTVAAVSPGTGGTTKTTQKPTVVTTTVCLWTPAGPTTTQASTTTQPTTTTTPVPTTTPPPTTMTTLPFCDTLTTTYTLITLNPLPSPVIYYSGTPRLNSHVGAGVLILLLAFVTKLFVD